MKNRGFSISEFLISTLLASLIIGALVNHFLSSKEHLEFLIKKTGKSLEQLNLQGLISDSIRNAGFTPCVGLDYLQTIDTRVFKPIPSVLSYEPNNFITRRMNYLFDEIIKFTLPNRVLLHAHVLNKEKPIVIADCFHAEIHQIERIEKIGENDMVILKEPFFFEYQAPAYIGNWIEEYFFIKNASLYYQLQRNDLLSAVIKAVTISWQKSERKLLKVSLIDENDDSLEFYSRVRNS
ncbi:Tfp pilus assembly protein PilW (plasmid) [Legionella adelaidensis]|uniref:Tfp pilus assembly protein PilW n=1 Tax=Legionella adelaidensis TaxID=45056 RepID=A0A0W0R1K3_9GAMM|nr:hypothetical protein [Legionella adelaidensis]KTC64933.1 hypothetical protein Lade_1740 [Legionella adelaidensis]VEH85616.1 Tfp pilus assembly protein PilW [Legionella adelaidensis]